MNKLFTAAVLASLAASPLLAQNAPENEQDVEITEGQKGQHHFKKKIIRRGPGSKDWNPEMHGMPAQGLWFSKGGGSRGGGGGEGMLDQFVVGRAHRILRNAKGLGITQEQHDKIKGAVLSAKKKNIEVGAKIESLSLDIHEALTAGKIDAKAVGALLDKKYALKADASKNMIEAHAAISAILTPEQLEKAKEARRGRGFQGAADDADEDDGDDETEVEVEIRR